MKKKEIISAHKKKETISADKKKANKFSWQKEKKQFQPTKVKMKKPDLSNCWTATSDWSWMESDELSNLDQDQEVLIVFIILDLNFFSQCKDACRFDYLT